VTGWPWGSGAAPGRKLRRLHPLAGRRRGSARGDLGRRLAPVNCHCASAACPRRVRRHADRAHWTSHAGRPSSAPRPRWRAADIPPAAASVFAVEAYDHSIPWSLRRTVPWSATRRARRGDPLEPQSSSPDLPGFARAWSAAPGPTSLRRALDRLRARTCLLTHVGAPWRCS